MKEGKIYCDSLYTLPNELHIRENNYSKEFITNFYLPITLYTNKEIFSLEKGKPYFFKSNLIVTQEMLDTFNYIEFNKLFINNGVSINLELIEINKPIQGIIISPFNTLTFDKSTHLAQWL